MISLEEIYQSWIDEKRLQVKQTTVLVYTYLMEHYILPVFAKETKITAKALQQFLNEWSSKGLSRNSLYGIISVIQMVIAYGAEKGWCHNLDRKLVLPSATTSSLPSTFDAKQTALLIQYLSSLNQKSMSIS